MDLRVWMGRSGGRRLSVRDSRRRAGTSMSPTVCITGRLLAVAFLLRSCSLSAAMPPPTEVELSGSGEGLLESSGDSGLGELQEPDSGIGTVFRNEEQLLPLSELSWTKSAGDEEPETGSGDGSTSHATPTVVKELVNFTFRLLEKGKYKVILVAKSEPNLHEEVVMEGDTEEGGLPEKTSAEVKEVIKLVIFPSTHPTTNSSVTHPSLGQEKNEKADSIIKVSDKAKASPTAAPSAIPSTEDTSRASAAAIGASSFSAEAPATAGINSVTTTIRTSTETGPTTTPNSAPDTALELSVSATRPTTPPPPSPEISSAMPPLATTTDTPDPNSEGDGRRGLRQEFCRTSFICVFHIWATVCVAVLALLVLRSAYNNGVSAVRWCCRIRHNCRRSGTMKAIELVNIGMDKKSWDTKSACSLQIKSEIETGLRHLFSHCDVTLEMVGSLSSRLGKSLNARPACEDSLQEYRFTEPVLGADADFMVVLQVPVAPTAAGGRELPRYVLEGEAPHMSLPPLPKSQHTSGPPLPWHWRPTPCRSGPAEGEAEADIELREFQPRPNGALSVLPMCEETPSPRCRQPSPLAAGTAGPFLWPAAAVADPAGSVTPGPPAGRRRPLSLSEDDTWANPAAAAARTDPDGDTSSMKRSHSLNMGRSLLRLPTLEASPYAAAIRGFARVQLSLDGMLPEYRQWWKSVSEMADGTLYLSSMEVRQRMRHMFETLNLNVEQERRDMSVVDSCLADYRGQPSYIKEVQARGPAITLKLKQSDDRAIANMYFFQNSCCYWLCLCFSVLLLLPFCVWIFLTGGSWPVRKCSGGACCSIYYTVTLLAPMLLVLPVLLLLLALWPPETDHDANQLHIWLVAAYVALSALFASLFVCVSHCFFKLPTIFYGDFVTALVCHQWPKDAQDFNTRSRQWPPRSEVDGIVRQGCHLVPKPPVPCRCSDESGDAPCRDAHLLWRYSFSKAEVRLSGSIPEHYRRAYMAFKWLVKHHITSSSYHTYGVQSNIRSYYIKTVLFWELDQQGVAEWSEGVEVELLSRLAARMLQHVRERFLPHFFIPKINLLKELTEDDFEKVERLMESILTDPAPLINMPDLKWKAYIIGMCEAIFCTPGRDFRSELCCNYASRLHSVW